MVRLVLAGTMVLTTASVSAQVGFMPPGGTSGQGTTGGIVTGGHVMWGPPAVASAPGEGVARAFAARADQVRNGSAVYSTGGSLIGKVAYANGKVAVVENNRWALRLPVQAFGIRRDALLLSMSPHRFEELARVGGAAR